MVTPSTGLLKSIIDEIATQLDDVDNLRIYKYSPDSIQEFPAALIRDNQASNQSSVAEFRTTTPKVVYNLEVVVVVNLADEQEAYEELEKYISSDSPSSVKALVDLASVAGVQSIQCIRAEPRRRFTVNNASLWGCSFWVKSIVT